MKKILFVDDEQKVLDGLRRMLHPLRKEWDMTFVLSAEEGLDKLKDSTFDVVVSDMRMPGMDGVEFLNTVKERYPHMIRIALSGHADMEMLLESVKATHQFLVKPCTADTLKLTIDRAVVLDSHLHSEEMNRVVAGIDSLPSLPKLYSDIMQEIASPESSLAKIGEIISQDVAMTAKILQMVNSAFFGLSTHVSSPAQATTLLGLDVIRGLILTSKVFSQFDQDNIPIDIEGLLTHSSMVGVLAKKIAQSESLDRKSCDHAQMAGMLHEIGLVIMASNFTERYKKYLEIMAKYLIPGSMAEQQLFGSTHGEIGAYLLGLWGLPYPIVESVAFHHHPQFSPVKTFTPLTAVYLANTLLEHSETDEDTVSSLDQDYLQSLGLTDKVPEWLQLRDEILHQGGEMHD